MMAATPSRKPIEGNILLVSNYASDTAYAWWLMEQFWITLAKIWAENGKKAYLAYPEVRAISNAIQSTSELEVVELTVSGRSPRQRKALLEFAKENDVRTVYFTDRAWFSMDHLLLRRAGIKNILIHDHTPGDRPRVQGWRRLVKKIRNRTPWMTADYVFCVSPLMRQRNIENGCLPPERCLVVQNGIPPLQPIESRAEIRERLGLTNKTTVVITTGRAHPYKRFDFVVRTAHQLQLMDPSCDICFLLVGGGPAMKQLRDLVRQLGLNGRVQLLGYRADAQQLLFAADIAMHAALGEGFSLSIVEYMSARLPVLVPDIPSVHQAIVNGKTGVIYPKDDSATAAKHLLTLVTNHELRATMGVAAAESASTQFTLTKCLRDLNEKVRSIYSSA